MRQRECKLVRQRRGKGAYTVRELTEIASRKRAVFEQIEQERVYVCTHRLHRVECEPEATLST